MKLINFNRVLLTTIFIKNIILEKLMETKKKVIILVTLAIILAITAISLNLSGSDISTTGNVISVSSGGGNIGIDIKPAPVEDKLAEVNGGTQS